MDPAEFEDILGNKRHCQSTKVQPPTAYLEAHVVHRQGQSYVLLANGTQKSTQMEHPIHPVVHNKRFQVAIIKHISVLE